MGILSILGIILLFMRPRPLSVVKIKRPESPIKLFTQVIEAAQPAILKLWENGDQFLPKNGTNCPEEIHNDKSVGKSYYQCNPHFWQCYWSGGVVERPALEVDLYGQKFHIKALPSFSPVSSISPEKRYYELFKRDSISIDLNYGYVMDVEILEVPNLKQRIVLSDSCRDVFLPQRIYGYGKASDLKEKEKENEFVWDNFNRNIFIDRFYVTNRQVNEWRLLKGELNKLELNREKWPMPAIISLSDQRSYCRFYGKRLLEAKLFDAASMSPSDIKNPLPDRVFRPDTPWQRDIGKSFLGTARVNPDYQLTPLDCQLAQVKGCPESYFSNDSATWMGFNYSLGFYPESLENFIEPSKNLKTSSKFLPPSSEWHELGKLSSWKGIQLESLPVAFRCYEEVAP